jgi:hypothetical protein
MVSLSVTMDRLRPDWLSSMWTARTIAQYSTWSICDWYTMGKRRFAVRFNVCRVLSARPTAKHILAVRFSMSARQTWTPVTSLFAVRFRAGTRQTQIFVVCFNTDAQQSFFFNATEQVPVRCLTDVNLCRASSCDARQTCTLPCVLC